MVEGLCAMFTHHQPYFIVNDLSILGPDLNGCLETHIQVKEPFNVSPRKFFSACQSASLGGGGGGK